MARQKFGQHFLVDANIIERILRVVAPAAGDVMLEIGPGRGALTAGLLDGVGDGALEAVEIDADLAAHLNNTVGAVGDNKHWRLHRADIMQFDFGALRETPKRRIVGNLPYQISGPLLMRLLTKVDRVSDMHFMLQLEVAERLCADVGDASYSALSVLVGSRATCEKLFEVEPAAFAPPPEVRSAFVRLTPKATTQATNDLPWEVFEELVRAVFTQRRKKLWRALDGRLNIAQIEALGIDPHCRPQSLSVKDYEHIARAAHPNGGRV